MPLLLSGYEAAPPFGSMPHLEGPWYIAIVPVAAAILGGWAIVMLAWQTIGHKVPIGRKLVSGAIYGLWSLAAQAMLQMPLSFLSHLIVLPLLLRAARRIRVIAAIEAAIFAEAVALGGSALLIGILYLIRSPRMEFLLYRTTAGLTVSKLSEAMAPAIAYVIFRRRSISLFRHLGRIDRRGYPL